jgi:hypothetical protein
MRKSEGGGNNNKLIAAQAKPQSIPLQPNTTTTQQSTMEKNTSTSMSQLTSTIICL